jgi:hypothetical protein
VNADASLFIANVLPNRPPIQLNEQVLRTYLDHERVSTKSIIKGYNFIGWTLNEVLSGSGQGHDQLRGFWCGLGLKNIGMYKV